MNKEFKTIEDKLVVTNEYGFKTERNITNNFKEILITENNIEEIEDLLIDEKNDEYYNISDIKRYGKYKFIIAGIWFIASILNLFIGNISIMCLDFSLVGMWTLNGFASINPYLKKLKGNKKSISTLEEHLTEEKRTLKELKKEEKNDLNFLNQISGELSTSEKIRNLKHKLLIIKIYEQHKRKLIKLYKQGMLENSYFNLFYGDDFEIVKELIQNDLQKENTAKKEKQNQKTLKLEKGDIDYSFKENE